MDGELYRRVNPSFLEEFNRLHATGLYDALVKEGLLLRHEVVEEPSAGAPGGITIRPERINFVSFPYEWSFSMLRDAALLTLRLAKTALRHGMILKDATPFNIQWHKGKFVFIDTLSFETYREAPWIAYRQFCECFLGPLLIMHYSRKQLPELMLAWPDGIPVSITSSLLPGRSRFSLFTYLHIHLHARYARRKSASGKQPTHFPQKKLENLLNSLEALVRHIRLPEESSTWSHYYEEAATRQDYLGQKKSIIEDWVSALRPTSAIDLGANEGAFSALLAQRNIRTLAADFDPWCIDRLYRSLGQQKETLIQPMVLDLSNPSPAIGLNNRERDSFLSRASYDLALALALIHHLVIGKNIPLPMIASTFCGISKSLIIEFVPREDEKVKLMLENKEDIYMDYTQENFEKSFSAYFSIEKRQAVGTSGRTLYLMKNKT